MSNPAPYYIKLIECRTHWLLQWGLKKSRCHTVMAIMPKYSTELLVTEDAAPHPV